MQPTCFSCAPCLCVRGAASVITAWSHDRETKDKKPFRGDHSVCLQVICHIKLQDLPLFGLAHPPVSWFCFLDPGPPPPFQKKTSDVLALHEQPGCRPLAPLTSGHTKDFGIFSIQRTHLSHSDHCVIFIESNIRAWRLTPAVGALRGKSWLSCILARSQGHAIASAN